MIALLFKSYNDSSFNGALKENDFINFKKEDVHKIYPTLFWKKDNYIYQFVTTFNMSGHTIVLITKDSKYFID